MPGARPSIHSIDTTYDGGGNDDNVENCEASFGVLAWLGDGWCDSSNNNPDCAYDYGDCCPGECLDTIADGCPDANQGAGGCYSGSEDGSWCGTCTDCIDEDSVDNAPGGECEDGGRLYTARCGRGAQPNRSRRPPPQTRRQDG